MPLNDSEDIIAALYRLYEQKLYFEAYSILHDEYLAEDAVHEAFLRLIRNRDKITDPRSPSVKGYIKKTIRSSALDIYRSRKKQFDNCMSFDDMSDTVTEEDAMTTLEAESVISDLPRKYRSVVQCLFIDCLSVRETSAVLKISEACVRKRCERARRLIHDMMKIPNEKKENIHER